MRTPRLQVPKCRGVRGWKLQPELAHVVASVLLKTGGRERMHSSDALFLYTSSNLSFPVVHSHCLTGSFQAPFICPLASVSQACSSLRKEHGELLSDLGVGAAAATAVREPGGAAGGKEKCHLWATLGEVSRGPALSPWQEILT